MKNLNKNKFLIGFMAIIGLIVSIGSVSILTIFQAEADDDNITISPTGKFSYSGGIEDKSITLQELNFTEGGQQSDTISSFYMVDNSVILTPNIIVGNSNSGRVLGGESNQTNSENVTIIGGQGNIVEGDGNKTIIGGQENKIEGNDNEGSIVGGQENKIEGDGFIIGGSNNELINSENSAILGGIDNTISNGENIIIAGENINVDGSFNNSFIFSNKDFSGQNPNTFYINAFGGLGINGNSRAGYFDSHGGLLIGKIDINNSNCDDTKIGIMGTITGCLISCTEYSASADKRSLLELSERCVQRCRDNSDKCITPPNTSDPNHITEPGFCTGYKAEGSIPCFDQSQRNATNYLDSVFSYQYVEICPENYNNTDNPCIYKCPEGYLFRDGACRKSCTKTGDNGEVITIPHGESISLYQKDSPKCPEKCISKDRTCKDGNLDTQGTLIHFIYTTCQVYTSGSNCDSSYNVEAGDRLSGSNYDSCKEYTINGNSCSSQTKYRIKGCQNGYTMVNGECKKNCDFNGTKVTHGKTVKGYKNFSATCDQADLCNMSYTLTCDDGNLGAIAQEYKYPKCTLEKVLCPAHPLSSCPAHGNCSSCTGYSVSNNTCTQFIKYKLESCDSGYTIDGGTSCKQDCQLPRGGSIRHGEKAVGYKGQTQTCPSICGDSSNRKEMTCNDGTLDGSNTYKYSSCTTQVPTPKGYKRNTKVDNAECETEIIYSVNNNVCISQQTKYECTACKAGYTRNGKDWDGDEAECLKDCTFTAQPSNNTVSVNGNGGTIITYSKGSFACPDLYSNYSQTRTCNNGILDGSYTYTSFSQTGTSCQKQDGDRKTFNHQLNQGANNVEPASAPCSEYSYSNSSCTRVTTYYTYKCKAGYKRSNNGTKCVKCTGEIPDNAHENNSSYPTSENTEYEYNDTNTSAVCTFSCNPGFERNGSECIDKGGKCYFDGVAYDESHSLRVYTEDKPVCSNTCDEIRITCDGGTWYDDNHNQVSGNLSGDCHTTAGYITSSATTPQKGSCSYSNSNASLKTFIGSNKPNKPNASLSKKCTNYQANNRSCTEGNTYRTFYCAGMWTGSAGNEECSKNCTYGNKTYQNGESLTLYNGAGFYTCPNQAQSQTRTCNNGSRSDGGFSSEYKYTTSEYHLLPEGCSNYNVSCGSSNLTEGNYEKCTIRRVSDNNTCVNVYEMCKITGCSGGYTMVDGECKKDCELSGGIKIAYGQSITGYKYTVQTCPYLCSNDYQVRTCGENGQLSGNSAYKYTRCSLIASNSCSISECPYESTSEIPEGTTYRECTQFSVNGNACEYHTRYCPTDCKAGYSLVDGECKQDCDFDGIKVKYNDPVTGYISPANCGTNCSYQVRTCGENGQLDGNNMYSSSRCTYKLSIVPSYVRTSCPDHGVCSRKEYYKTGGTEGSEITYCRGYMGYIFNRCQTGYTRVIEEDGNIICLENCHHDDLGEVAHGGKVTAYKFIDGACKSITRTCNNGILEGDLSYNSKTCETCKTPIGEILKGTSLTLYTPAVCPNTSCSSQTLTCTDEYIGENLNFLGGYVNKTCKVYDNPASCGSGYIFTGGSFQSGGIYTGGCRAYTYNGSSCITEERYKLIGCQRPYTKQGNKCLRGCTTPWNSSVTHGTPVTAYSTGGVLCLSSSTKCEGQTKTCVDGGRYPSNFGQEYIYPTCSVQPYSCQKYPLSASQINTTNCTYFACTPCTTENGVCNETNTTKYALIGANSGYYATGATCSAICGNGASSTPCNGPYTATGLEWQLPNSNRRVNLRGTGYKCVKNNNSVLGASETKCDSCPPNTLWNGSSCGSFPQDPCINETPNTCSVGYPINQKSHQGGYTWTCKTARMENDCHKCNSGYERNEQTKSCEKPAANGKCKYGESGPSCEVGTVINHTSNNQCSHSWTCKGENGGEDALCSMLYEPGGSLNSTSIHYKLQPNQWTYEDKCKSYYPDVYNSASVGSMTFTNDDKCAGATDLGIYVASINGSQLGDKCYVQSNNLPNPGCGQCFICNVDYKEYEESEGACYIEGIAYDKNDSRCNGIRTTSCYPQTKPINSACARYNLTNTNICNNVKNIPNTTYYSFDSCRSAAKLYGAVRSQSYGIGNTSWTIGDSCNIDTDPYCVPCVSCTSIISAPPASCEGICSAPAVAFGIDSPNLGNGGSSDPNRQISRKIAECADSCGHPATKTCGNVTWVNCCKNS